MNEPLGMLVDIAVAVAVMFICPLVCCIGMAERLEDNYLQMRVDEFSEEICSNGSLEPELYEMFLRNLSISGKRHDVDIICETTVWEPVYESGAFTGRAVSYAREIGTEEIVDIAYERGNYYFRYGDTVRVILTDASGTFAMSEGVVNGFRGAAE